MSEKVSCIHDYGGDDYSTVKKVDKQTSAYGDVPRSCCSNYVYGVHQPIRDKESSDSCDPSTTSSEGISSSTLSSDSNDSIFTVMKTKQTLQGNRLAVELVKIGGQCS